MQTRLLRRSLEKELLQESQQQSRIHRDPEVVSEEDFDPELQRDIASDVKNRLQYLRERYGTNAAKSNENVEDAGGDVPSQPSADSEGLELDIESMLRAKEPGVSVIETEDLWRRYRESQRVLDETQKLNQQRNTRFKTSDSRDSERHDE